MKGKIYKITNKINGKSYIGQTVLTIENRFKRHISQAKKNINRYLYDSMNHYGYDNFLLELVEDNIDKSILDEKEKYYIQLFNTKIPNGYNMTDGGFGTQGWMDNLTEVEKQEMWNRQKISRNKTIEEKYGVDNIFRLTEFKEIIRQSRLGKRMSDKQKKSISETNKRKGIQPPDYTLWKKGQVGAFMGKHHSDESKQKISDFRKGKTYEELYGEKSIEIKNKLKEKVGSKNPNYIVISKKDELIITNLIKQKLKLKDICEKSGFSIYKIRCFLRKFGITNYQKQVLNLK